MSTTKKRQQQKVEEVGDKHQKIEEGGQWVSTVEERKDSLISWVDPSLVQPFDLSKAVADLLGCRNVYFADTKYETKTCTVKKNGKPVKDNQFGFMNFTKYDSQTFLHNKLKYGTYILFPLAILSKGYMPPYGTNDIVVRDNDPNPDLRAPSSQTRSSAVVTVEFRTTPWNKFSNFMDHDPAMLRACGFMIDVVEPKSWNAAITAGMGGGPTMKSMWNTEEGDLGTLCIRSTHHLFRRPDDPKLVKQLADKTYKAYTEHLTKICHNSVQVMNDVKWYRATTAQERVIDPAWLKPLTWLEASVISTEGDTVVMVLDKVSPLQNNKGFFRDDLTVEHLIWFGTVSAFASMKENTVEEFFRCIPPFPPAPQIEEVWLRKEKGEEQRLLDKELEALKKDREL